jgi:hypothetical protein
MPLSLLPCAVLRHVQRWAIPRPRHRVKPLVYRVATLRGGNMTLELDASRAIAQGTRVALAR